MFQRVRKHISPATVVAFMALIFAMTGGAFAASSGSGGGSSPAKATASTTLATAAKAKPKAKAGPRGPAGAKGATGPAGATGSAGPAGPAGATGPAGAGTAGATGAIGATGATGAPGAVGPAGPEGSFNTTLPKGKTLKGDWSAFGKAPEAGFPVVATVSFGIPLASAPATHYLRPGGNEEPFFDGTTGKEGLRSQPACPGSAEEPKAEPGNLCVYAADEEDSLKEFAVFKVVFPVICQLSEATLANGGAACIAGQGGVPAQGVADKYGFAVHALAESEKVVQAAGTWAVTAG
jgi:hypothetical protein